MQGRSTSRAIGLCHAEPQAKRQPANEVNLKVAAQDPSLRCATFRMTCRGRIYQNWYQTAAESYEWRTSMNRATDSWVCQGGSKPWNLRAASMSRGSRSRY